MSPSVEFKCYDHGRNPILSVRLSWRGAEKVWPQLGETPTERVCAVRDDHVAQGHRVVLTARRGRRREVVA